MANKDGGKLVACELFAGVGGFHLGLAASEIEVRWANQWEPGVKKQHAYECYKRRFPHTTAVNEDIALVLTEGAKKHGIPDPHDLVVGGFPCQDYSVAKPKSHAAGIQGKKGVLWWEIEKWLKAFKPSYLLLENVDRLLKSPTSQRGRDFAVMLSCLAALDYEVEWRVLNAADYGFRQKRRRVFIFGRHRRTVKTPVESPERWLLEEGVLAKACPVDCKSGPKIKGFQENWFLLDSKQRSKQPWEVSKQFSRSAGDQTAFRSAGFMRGGEVWTFDVEPRRETPGTIRGILVSEARVPERYRVSPEAKEKWIYLKGPKSEPRVDPRTGHKYHYTEGGIPCPDDVDGPSRTILTGEGGATPSRFKHVIDPKGDGNFRRLMPEELEQLNGFPAGWTEGMPEGRRAFCMGNALVVGLVERIGKQIVSLAGGTVPDANLGKTDKTHPKRGHSRAPRRRESTSATKPGRKPRSAPRKPKRARASETRQAKKRP